MSKRGGKSSGDIEEGTHHSHSHQTESDEDSLCFSDAEAHSWQSPYGSNGGGSTYDEGRVSAASCLEIDGSREHGRKSCVSESSLDDDDDDDDTEMGASEVKVNIDKVERDCRICHLSLEKAAPESGVAIVLGCSCKGDLAAAHKQCAETWFKIKGNKICEICGSTAMNVVGVSDAEPIEQWSEANTSTALPAAEQWTGKMIKHTGIDEAHKKSQMYHLKFGVNPKLAVHLTGCIGPCCVRNGSAIL
ncbi:hypothetical protein OPV22_025873 [Ensete ventricosum]|uniref:RING-CH-type domain-containing protein n=1 Tax=Ensete ventricosum TaxID=4639 RepID=A0AAV8QIK3_ENSVE|nr:hypothetical protein OPV22_025873 [Ensete ventricosum]